MGKATAKRKKTRAASRTSKGRKSSTSAAKRTRPSANALAGTRRLYDTVRIADVVLVGCHVDLRSRPQDALRLGVRRTAQGVRSPDGTRICAEVRFTLEGRMEQGRTGPPSFLIEATFQGIYEVPTDIETDESSLELFAQTNGTFNLWPYWREFVQSMSARMGLPTITVPSYRVEEAMTGPGTADREAANHPESPSNRPPTGRAKTKK